MVLHYLTNGTVKLRFFYRRQPIYLPLILVLKCLADVSDQYIFNELIKGRNEDNFYKSCIVNMFRLVQNEKLYTSKQIMDYIGERVRVRFEAPSWYSNEDITEQLFNESIAVHLRTKMDKFNLLVFMTRKLFVFVQGECAQENPDNPMFHEASQSGHIFFTLLLDRMGCFLSAVKQLIERNYQQAMRTSSDYSLNNQVMRKVFASKYFEITRAVDFLITTGNVNSRTGLGLLQTSGITVKAEKINFWRFLAHFRCIHRGQFFTEMKTTACRKLYPEAWGFLCPVHTPDGSPCGLLNHLSELCEITNSQASIRHLPALMLDLGMMEPSDLPVIFDQTYLTVLLDGRVVGFIKENLAKHMTDRLRSMKALGENKVPASLEIGLIPRTTKATQFPGVYLFTTPSRLVRPVYNLATKTLELISTFEQCYMDICVAGHEAVPGVTTHREIRETSFLSVLARQIPYPDFNQSPRNMYSCQMAKQTMGTASHTIRYRSDNKMYSVTMPQSPLVRTTAYDHYQLDNYPLGTNAVVAVISYTGYDMEDAMIINKASMERGLHAGVIHKTEVVDLRELAGVRYNSADIDLQFGYTKSVADRYQGMFEADGLPVVGRLLKQDDPVCAYIDLVAGETKLHKYKSSEPAYIADVKVLGDNSAGEKQITRVAITYLIRRDPIIGDKFANRHGQKGICSFLWPQEDMPFSESGIVPDILFNPHGFPSRMTIGQMIETLAGKAGAMQGDVHDSTPFNFSEDNVASEHYGKLLESCGFNFYGTEKMYSGVDGRELEADIFVGVVYYIRLRHMVGDKYQVRSTGPIDQITHQPVKGRKRAGGIRFGEMERDSLLAHGTTFLLQDRLFNNSDKTMVSIIVCNVCLRSID